MLKIILRSAPILLLSANLYAAEARSVFENQVLTIPSVDLPEKIAPYQNVQFKLANDGRWELLFVKKENLAKIEKLEIQKLKTFPEQVHVVVSGYFPDGCYNLGETFVRRVDNRFEIAVNQNQLQTLVACTQALVPFKTRIVLDVYGLAKGRYDVVVNNLNDAFELTQDNILLDKLETDVVQ